MSRLEELMALHDQACEQAERMGNRNVAREFREADACLQRIKELRAALERALRDALEHGEKMQKALTNLCKVFPTDGEMEDAEWNDSYVEMACKTYDEAKEALAAAPKEPTNDPDVK